MPRQIRRRSDAGLAPCPLITHGLTAWTWTYLLGVETFGHGPRGDDVVHDTLAERLGHLVQFHELPHVVQHVVVLGRRRGHLLDDGRHMAEDRRVQQSYRRERRVYACVWRKRVRIENIRNAIGCPSPPREREKASDSLRHIRHSDVARQLLVMFM